MQALANELNQIQSSKSALKLSEANCVELVSKLVRSGNLKLLYTLDGQEYVTEKQLEFEIIDEVNAAGRVEVNALPGLLNIDLEHIRKIVERLVSDPNGDFKLVEGELITDYYLGQVCREVQETLALEGELSLSSLAKKFDFSSEYFTNLVRLNLGKTIFGTLLEGEMIYTDLYLNRERQRMFGRFSAITTPTEIVKILKSLEMKEKIFFSLLDQMKSNGTLNGEISGKRNINELFTPSIYNVIAEKFIRSFFETNSFVPYERVLTAFSNVENPQKWLKERFPKGILLQSCMVEDALLMLLEAHIEENFGERGDGWLALEGIIPSIFITRDTELLLDELKKKKSFPKAQLFEDDYLVSDRLIGEMEKQMEEKLIPECVEQFAKTVIPEISLTKSSDKAGTETSKKKKNKSSKSKDQSKGEASGPQKFFSVEICTKFLTSLYSKLAQEDDQQLLNFLGRYLHEKLANKYLERCQKAQQEMEAAAASAAPPLSSLELTRDQINALMTEFTIHYHNMGLFLSALTSASFPADQVPVMEKHVLKTTGMSLVCICMKLEASANKLRVIGNLMDEGARTNLLKQFPESSAVLFQSLLKSMNSAKSFQKALQNCMELCQLRVKPLDKKSEKPIIAGHREGFLMQLEKEQDPALVLHLSCVSLFVIYKHAVLNIPSRCINAVMSVLEKVMAKEDFQILKNLNDKVVQILQMEKSKAEQEKKELISMRLKNDNV